MRPTGASRGQVRLMHHLLCPNASPGSIPIRPSHLPLSTPNHDCSATSRASLHFLGLESLLFAPLLGISTAISSPFSFLFRWLTYPISNSAPRHPIALPGISISLERTRPLCRIHLNNFAPCTNFLRKPLVRHIPFSDDVIAMASGRTEPSLDTTKRLPPAAKRHTPSPRPVLYVVRHRLTSPPHPMAQGSRINQVIKAFPRSCHCRTTWIISRDSVAMRPC